MTAALALVLLAGRDLHAQCALCKEALRSDPETARIAAGFEWGTYFIGGLLITMTVSVVILLFRTARRFTVHAPPLPPVPAESGSAAQTA